MAYTDRRHHHARFAKAPKGFTPHRGKKPPIKGNVFVELLHKTDEGWAIGPRTNAQFIREDDWAALRKAEGRWRLAPELPLHAGHLPHP